MYSIICVPNDDVARKLNISEHPRFGRFMLPFARVICEILHILPYAAHLIDCVTVSLKNISHIFIWSLRTLRKLKFRKLKFRSVLNVDKSFLVTKKKHIVKPGIS